MSRLEAQITAIETNLKHKLISAEEAVQLVDAVILIYTLEERAAQESMRLTYVS